MNVSSFHYTMLIEWSEADQAFLVTLPEWAEQVMMPVTHGETYIEAVQKGQEIIEMLVSDAKANGEVLPTPRGHVA
jgi:predicted RNase H-like HicB family nuclease